MTYFNFEYDKQGFQKVVELTKFDHFRLDPNWQLYPNYNTNLLILFGNL